MSAPAITDRRDLARHLQAQMMAARLAPTSGEAGEEEESSGRMLVKSYMIEAHDGGESAFDAATTLAAIAPTVGASFNATRDPDLFRLLTRDGEFWCDTSLERYWRLHTTVRVHEADRFRDQFIASTRVLDNVWLPASYLEKLAARTQSHMETFSLNHDRRMLLPSGVENAELDAVTMRLWASRCADMLGKLRTHNILPHGLSVRSVKLRAGSWEPDEDYCVAEYFHDGKVSAKGTSFDEHTRLLVTILADYRRMVEHIEDRYGIGCVEDDRGAACLSGDPIVIDMQWTLDDLDYAVARMFSSGPPFRLWGLPERVRQGHYRAHAVDLHVGGLLTFDITRDHIVIQLPRGTCGNTVVRFLGLVHYHVNSDVGQSLVQ
jgi:hypothetical protein